MPQLESTFKEGSKSFRNILRTYAVTTWSITGSTYCITSAQCIVMRRALEYGQPARLHHGGLPGTDFEIHGLWRECCPDSEAIIWPVSIRDSRRYTQHPRVTIKGINSIDDQNRAVASRCNILFACPIMCYEERGTRTWDTIALAQMRGTTVFIVWPDGRATLRIAEDELQVTLD